MLFHACPLLHQWSHDHEQAFNTFMQYKTRVPVCGAIMLNDTWEKVCLKSIKKVSSHLTSLLYSVYSSKAGNHLLDGVSLKAKSMNMRLHMIVQRGRCVFASN